MIAKGNNHSNWAKLADYLEKNKDGERAELWQLRGFGATNIKDAFRDVQIMSEATKCEQPFFHVQVRNREGEAFTRQQFEYAADRIERMLGLTGQPRAISFHTYEHNDDQHMHVAWSRIDQDTLTAKPLPFFKDRLMKISRELELHFGLEPVTSRREGPIKYAPTKVQEEQARRLGLDAHELRNTIRDCWDRSDNGHSFQTALEHEGMTLAQGERRDFVVIDQRGGTHVLSKRTLDVTAAGIRDRLSDVSREELPSVEQTRDFLREVSNDRKQEQHDIKVRLKQELAEVDRLLYGPSLGDLKRELKQVQGLIEKAQRNQQTAKPAPVWDRDRDDRAWQVAVVNAAIEKEKIAKEFVEPKARETRAGGRQAAGSREKGWPVTPPTPEPTRTSPRYHFEDAARKAARPMKEAVNQRAEQHAERSGTAHPERTANAKTDPRTVTNGSFRRSVKVGKAATRTIGKTLDAVGSAVESLFAPPSTPAQIREGERAAHRREADVERTVDFAKYTGELAHQHQQHENEREAERQRHGEGGGRER